MPLHCCVPLCKQRGVKDNNGNKVSFFAFPKEPTLRKKWVIAIKRDEGKLFSITKYTKVCSLHFQEKDYLSNIASGFRFLKERVAPSVFGFNAAKKPPRRAPLQRMRATSNLTAADEDATDHAITDMDNVASNVTTIQRTKTEGALLEAQTNLQLALTKCRSLERREAELAETKQALYKTQRQLKLALAKCETLEAKSSRRFCIDCFKDSPADIQFYTGLPSYGKFMSLWSFLKPGEDGENVKVWATTYSGKVTKAGRLSILSSKDQLFLLLVRLRLGLFERDLAYRFRVSTATVSKICITWISYLYLHLGQIPLWLTREEVDDSMPPAFKDRYSTTRVILDATEVKCQASSSLVLQSATFSAYKSTNTFKGLIGISPDGTVTFVSELFTGSMSDNECVENSGFLKLRFNNKDSVMADKGFRIEDLLKEINVELNTPPFLRKGNFTTEEVKETEEIASLRIHVERRIQRVKSFHIFDRPVSISLAPVVNEMWFICAVLTNFQGPLMRTSDD
ncbi:unnamed protein product [Ixodes pacificus]